MRVTAVAFFFFLNFVLSASPVIFAVFISGISHEYFRIEVSTLVYKRSLSMLPFSVVSVYCFGLLLKNGRIFVQ